MTDLQSLRLSTGVDLDVAITGDPTHPPVILLHGFPESHRTWRHIAPDLARDHYVIAPDQRGFARSSKPQGVDSYTPDKIVADLLALADQLKIDRFTLVGHDWGGAIAWMAALQHPDRIERLVIVNAPTRSSSSARSSTTPNSARRASISAASATPRSTRD